MSHLGAQANGEQTSERRGCIGLSGGVLFLRDRSVTWDCHVLVFGVPVLLLSCLVLGLFGASTW